MDAREIDLLTKRTGKRRRVKIAGNLHINVTDKGTRSWLLFLRMAGTVEEIGLGRYPEVSFAAAKLMAEAPDPRAARTTSVMPTFGAGFRAVLAIREQDWQGQDLIAQIRGWQREMDLHGAALVDRPIDAITVQEVAGVLDSVTNSRTGERSEVLAARLRKRIELVFSWAAAQTPPFRTDNPAQLDVQKFVARKIKPKHVSHGACPHERVAELLSALPSGVAGEAARFATMTGVRVNEAAGARWEEFDLIAGLWTIPPVRMKAKVRHIVPLSRQALGLVGRMERDGSGYVFPGRLRNPHVSPIVTSKTLRESARRLGIVDADTGKVATMHGMRAAFTNWAVEHGHSRDDALACIGHLHGTASDRAYLRTAAFGRRRAMIQSWGEYVTGGPLAFAVADAGETGEARRPEPKRSGVFDIATQTHR